MSFKGNKYLIDRLAAERTLPQDGLISIMENGGDDGYLFAVAREALRRSYGPDIYIRGLIEFTNYCSNDCYYCGIRCGNRLAERYRLTEGEILDCCRAGYELGCRTFVLQGGEDGYFDDGRLSALIRLIKGRYSDTAITLSLGERSTESYRALFDAGADRYLLRHETADSEHYGMLHPLVQSLEARKKCLWVLKDMGWQVGCGFMVGSPYQTAACIVKDLLFIGELRPHMVGIGPFIPHKDTPFAGFPAGSVRLTLVLLAIIRLMLPDVLLPATTALDTLSPDGLELGIMAGANVVMPNLSPEDAREKYTLYRGKAGRGGAAEAIDKLKEIADRVGYRVAVTRGDHRS